MLAVQYEKMDAERPGEPGGQGEYKVQTGFGWSNGVVLQLLSQYGWRPELSLDHRPWLPPKVGGTASLCLIAVILGGLLPKAELVT